MAAYKLTPADSWFFRDGRPYNQGETNQTDVRSLFPPYAPTVVGAIRASLARSMGWQGKGSWTPEIKSKLGDGQDLGPLRFKGPHIMRIVDGKDELLFPAPLNLMAGAYGKDKRWTDFALLSPGSEIECDLGKVRLPSARSASGSKPLSECYLSSRNLGIVLQSGDLGQVLPINANQLWESEYSVGIKRSYQSRTTEEGALYSSWRVRLHPWVALAVEVEGLDGMKLDQVLTLGGEGRAAYVEPAATPMKLPDPAHLKPSEDGKIRFSVVHLTPAYFDGSWPGPGDSLPGIPEAKVVSACLERPLRIGGWDSVRHEPLLLKPFLPGGSVWFCEADHDSPQEIMGLNGSQIGSYVEYGFGQIVIGSWRSNQGV